MTIDAEVRELIDKAGSDLVIEGLLGPAQVGARSKRRDRRRRVVGGFATVLLVVLATVGIGLVRGEDGPNAVFASDADRALSPQMVVVHRGGYVGLASIDAPALTDPVTTRSVVVTSPDGTDWSPVDDAPTVDAQSVILAEHDGEVHIVAILGSQNTSDVVLQHLRASDLDRWTQRSVSWPDPSTVDGLRPLMIDVGFVDDSLILVTAQSPTTSSFDEALQALGLDRDQVCEMFGGASQISIRKCGTVKRLVVSADASLTFGPTYELWRLDRAGLVPVDIPVPDSTAPIAFRSPPSLYQTADGVGLVGRRNFETTDGVTWQQRDLGGPFFAMVAVRGDEQIYRTPYSVTRYGPNDPVKGMGFSVDAGETWVDLRPDLLFDDELTTPPLFSDLSVGSSGWALVIARSPASPVPVEGVELDPETDPVSFALSADGFTLTGRTPYGPATLRDPSGTIVQRWEQLEVTNPEWSGLKVVGGDVVVVDSITGRKIVAFTAEQWSAVTLNSGANTFDVLFSRNGADWTSIDTSSSFTNVLAVGDDGVLVQRLSVGSYSPTAAPLDLLPLPPEPAAED